MPLPPSIVIAACGVLIAGGLQAQDFSRAHELKFNDIIGSFADKPAELLKSAPAPADLLRILARAREVDHAIPATKIQRFEGRVDAHIVLDGREYIIVFPLPLPDGSKPYRFSSVMGPANKQLPEYEVAPADARELGLLLKAFK